MRTGNAHVRCAAAPQERNHPGMASKVFVGNLNFQTTRDELQSLFSQVGQVKDVFLPTDRVTDRPRGFAFVEFSSDEEAAKAIEKFNGHELGGRPLRVNAAEERPRGQRPFTPRPGGGGDSGGFGGGGGYGGGGGGFGGGGDDRGGYGGGGGGGFGGGKAKGSRRNVRAKKRQL